MPNIYNSNINRDWVNNYAKAHSTNKVDDRDSIKNSLRRMIKDNPDIYNEILTEMRAEKIQKIKNGIQKR